MLTTFKKRLWDIVCKGGTLSVGWICTRSCRPRWTLLRRGLRFRRLSDHLYGASSNQLFHPPHRTWNIAWDKRKRWVQYIVPPPPGHRDLHRTRVSCNPRLSSQLRSYCYHICRPLSHIYCLLPRIFHIKNCSRFPKIHQDKLWLVHWFLG